MASFVLSWSLYKRIEELNAKPLVNEQKDTRVTKGPVKITETTLKKNGDQITRVTEKSPEVIEKSIKRDESRPLANQNKVLIGPSFNANGIDAYHLGYGFANRVDILGSYRPKDKAVLGTLIFRF